MITGFLLLASTMAFGGDLPAGQTKMEALRLKFETADAPKTVKELTGWYSGRCYDSSDENQERAGLLVVMAQPGDSVTKVIIVSEPGPGDQFENPGKYPTLGVVEKALPQIWTEISPAELSHYSLMGKVQVETTEAVFEVRKDGARRYGHVQMNENPRDAYCVFKKKLKK